MKLVLEKFESWAGPRTVGAVITAANVWERTTAEVFHPANLSIAALHIGFAASSPARYLASGHDLLSD